MSSRPVQRNLQQQSAAQDFFSQQNRQKLTGVLTQDFQQRQQLSQRQMDRLGKTLDHYMREVYQFEGEKPLNYLNRAVVGATATDFAKYLQRQDVVKTQQQTPEQTITSQQSPFSQQQINGLLTNSPSENTRKIPQEDGLFQDISRRYELLQQQRNDQKEQPPAIPDFRVPLDREQPAAISLFEQARKAREQEAATAAAMAVTTAASQTQPSIQSQQPRSLAQYLERLQPIPAQAVIPQPESASVNQPLPIRPDGREIYQANFSSTAELQIPTNEGGSGFTLIQPRSDLGIAETNPTISAPSFQEFKPQQPSGQNVVTPNDQDMVYRENESNLVIYSYDRNWLVNTTENRYNFTVNFDPGNLSSSTYHYNTSIQKKLKNIVRLQLIKAILPVESLENLVISDISAQSSNLFGSTVDTSFQVSALNYPYVVLNIQEYDGNNYGTDNYQDRSFGTIHYERQWQSDNAHATIPIPTNQPIQCQDSRGYVLMVPRYLDCQRVFTPTPLSTLQRLTINIQNPIGNTLSVLPDTFDISGFFPNTSTTFSISTNSASGSAAGTASTQMGFIFIQTTKYFPRSAINIGDRIVVGGINYTDAALTANPGLQDFANWINQTDGHLVCNVGFVNSSGTTYLDGYNQLGYCNFIIINGRYADPTTGAVSALPFTGTSGTGLTGANLQGNNSNFAPGPKRLINLNRQTNLVFRVITREKDGQGQLRPNNLF